MGYWVATGVTLGLLTALMVFEWKDDQRGRWVLKPLTSAGFIASAVMAGALDDGYGQAVLAALVLSWFGDVFLIPKEKPKVFLLGVLAFLLGHVAFSVAFVIKGVSMAWVLGSVVPLGLVAAVVVRWLWPHVPAQMKGAVLAYVGVISTMLALAIGAVAAGANLWIFVGALMFYLSDLSVARQSFVTKSFINRLWGLPFYFIAQLIFAWTVLQP